MKAHKRTNWAEVPPLTNGESGRLAQLALGLLSSELWKAVLPWRALCSGGERKGEHMVVGKGRCQESL